MMAKPIESTPRLLTLKESIEFLKEMRKTDKSKLTDRDKKTFKTLVKDFLLPSKSNTLMLDDAPQYLKVEHIKCERCGAEIPSELILIEEGIKHCMGCHIRAKMRRNRPISDRDFYDITYPECPECKSRNTVMVQPCTLSSSKKPWRPYLCKECGNRF